MTKGREARKALLIHSNRSFVGWGARLAQAGAQTHSESGGFTDESREEYSRLVRRWTSPFIILEKQHSHSYLAACLVMEVMSSDRSEAAPVAHRVRTGLSRMLVDERGITPHHVYQAAEFSPSQQVGESLRSYAVTLGAQYSETAHVDDNDVIADELQGVRRLGGPTRRVALALEAMGQINLALAQDPLNRPLHEYVGNAGPAEIDWATQPYIF